MICLRASQALNLNYFVYLCTWISISFQEICIVAKHVRQRIGSEIIGAVNVNVYVVTFLIDVVDWMGISK